MRRNRWRCPAALLCVALVSALACASAPVGGVDAQTPPITPLLWRAEGPGGNVLYLLGSVHMGTRHALDLGRSVEEAYAASDELVVELDLSVTSPLEMVRLTYALGSLPPGETLREHISPETHALLVEFLNERRLPIEGLEQLEPWLVTAALSAIELQSAGYQAELGVDQLFMSEALDRKPIVALETVASQLAMLDGLPAPIQELMLLDVLARRNRFQAEAVGLVEAWEEGDEEELASLLFSPQQEFPELAAFYDKVFFERNQTMCARLRELASDGKTRFVILGAGHMLGPRGIPALLAERGFAVVRLGSAGARRPVAPLSGAAPAAAPAR